MAPCDIFLQRYVKDKVNITNLNVLKKRTSAAALSISDTLQGRNSRTVLTKEEFDAKVMDIKQS